MPNFAVEAMKSNRPQMTAGFEQAGATYIQRLPWVSQVMPEDVWVVGGEILTAGDIFRVGGLGRIEAEIEYAFFTSQPSPAPDVVHDAGLPLLFGSPLLGSAKATGMPEFDAQQSLTPLLNLIGAPAAWQHTLGEGTTVIVIDAGVDGSLIPADKRAGEWTDDLRADPWVDIYGHGTMLALMAAGSGASNGFPGVAPAARVFSARPALGKGNGLASTSVLKALDHVIGMIMLGNMDPAVVIAGFGMGGCSVPPDT